MSLLKDSPHRRFNPLTGEWVLVSPHRTSRPWLGQTEAPPATATPQYDPSCYLCPGNMRANGLRNPDYKGVLAFDNDYAALSETAPAERFDDEGLLVASGEPGICRVLCFSDRHDLTLSRMKLCDIVRVVEAWREEDLRLGAREMINYVQIFENRGAAMGASNPHPHCQIWATHSVPTQVAKENDAQADYLAQRGGCLLCDYLALEEKRGERVVCANDCFVALIPFWATWPFETMLVARRHIGGFDEFSDLETRALADVLRRLTARYDNLFGSPFPYSMGFHQRPSDGDAHPHWHFHGHFYPPMLRSASVRKFMVGFELLASPQRDITPESAADRLRRASEQPLGAPAS